MKKPFLGLFTIILAILVIVFSEVSQYAIMDLLKYLKIFPTYTIEVISLLILSVAEYSLYARYFTVKNKAIFPLVSKSGLLTSVICGIGVYGLVTIIVNFLLTFENIPSISQSLQTFDKAMADFSSDGVLIMILNVVILGPIYEEIVFRGFVYNILNKTKNSTFAVMATGLMFGIWHGILFQSIYTSIMGIVITYIYHKTKSLPVVIIVHMINNLLASFEDLTVNFYIITASEIIPILFIIPMIIILTRNERQEFIIGGKY